MYLSVCMRENIKRLVKYLAEKKTIDSEQEEDILDEASDTLKSQTLLDYLLKKDEEAFTNFYEGCLHSHMWKAADILEPEKGPHQPREEEIEEFLPENWPTESHFDVIRKPHTLRIKKIGPRHTQMMGIFEESTKNSDAYYDMSQKVKGRVLIINNQHFAHFPERSGSNYDRAGLDYVFSQLSFEIRVEEDLTEAKMKEVMEDEAKKRDHSLYNCFVMAILSYGLGDRQVLCTDAKDSDDGKIDHCFGIDQIKNIFAKVPQLATKPKVFLIEAEQIKPGRHREKQPSTAPSSGNPNSGSASGDSKTVTDSVDGDFQDKFMSSFKVHKSEIDKAMEKMQTLTEGVLKGFRNTETDDPSSISGGALVTKTVPLLSDIITAVATFKERLMHKKEPCGSWFIQAFLYVVANYAHQNDLQMLIQKINDLTVQQKGMASIQVCSSISTLNKKLYFFPGLPIEA